MRYSPRIFRFVLPVLALLAGYVWGMSLIYGDIGAPPNQFTFFGALGIALLMLGQVHAIQLCWKDARSKRLADNTALWLHLPLAAYAAYVMFSDPFFDPPYNYQEMILKVLILVPFVLCYGLFWKKGNLAGAIASLLFLAVSVAVLFFNTRYRDWWVGFFMAGHGH